MTASRRGPGPNSPGAPQSLTNLNDDKATTDILVPLLAKSTVAGYRRHGPLTARELEDAAHDLRWLAVELRLQRHEFAADAAVALADRLDESGELARLLADRRQAVA